MIPFLLTFKLYSWNLAFKKYRKACGAKWPSHFQPQLLRICFRRQLLLSVSCESFQSCLVPIEAFCMYASVYSSAPALHLYRGLHTIHTVLGRDETIHRRKIVSSYIMKKSLLKISSTLVNLCFFCFFFFLRFPFVAVSIGFVVNKKVCCLNLWLVKCLAVVFWERVNESPW